ncbi:MAG TPA: NifU N-terminal domain-containing protein, partial [Chitinophagales bacterium]|nr:NifU N-terminal domain-containing protein [Chitinophagales bacterium]
MQTPDTTTALPVTVYTEMTPNPETMKFVTDRMLLPNISVDFTEPSS